MIHLLIGQLKAIIVMKVLCKFLSQIQWLVIDFGLNLGYKELSRSLAMTKVVEPHACMLSIYCFELKAGILALYNLACMQFPYTIWVIAFEDHLT